MVVDLAFPLLAFVLTLVLSVSLSTSGDRNKAPKRLQDGGSHSAAPTRLNDDDP
ncbi:hypothetical protein [Nodosilinea sp. E11]|uniref:hypothetical protein n=1 Tax=Nodosilinea sp. E11 TaxID=3037479 RepID=UPI0029345CDD|nr:hypothetical protein [Nodosilinea sp. E11]WOD37377.1 hypothetical protein RRF56_02545 [Nodosilinea sp. E11]WOD37939.1 hypothetical protein RRF56_17135 [Nodosilinea sp. E11]